MVVEAHRVIRFFCHNSVAILLRARNVGSRVPVTGRLLLKGRDFPRDNSFTRAHRHRPSSPRIPLENVEFNDVLGTSCPFLIFIPSPHHSIHIQDDQPKFVHIHPIFSFNNKSITILIFEIIKYASIPYF